MAALDWIPRRGARQTRQRLRARGADNKLIVSQMPSGNNNNAKRSNMPRQRLGHPSPASAYVRFFLLAHYVGMATPSTP